MLLSAVSVLVAAQSSSEIPEGLMNNPVYPVRELCGGETASPLVPALCISDRLYEGGFISDKQQPTPSLGEICKQPDTLPTKRWIFLIVGEHVYSTNTRKHSR